jgi:hypothetical protein
VFTRVYKSDSASSRELVTTSQRSLTGGRRAVEEVRDQMGRNYVIVIDSRLVIESVVSDRLLGSQLLAAPNVTFRTQPRKPRLDEGYDGRHDCADANSVSVTPHRLKPS